MILKCRDHNGWMVLVDVFSSVQYDLVGNHGPFYSFLIERTCKRSVIIEHVVMGIAWCE